MKAVRVGSRRRRDRGARVVVTAGGVTIIASVLGILVFLLVQVLPLLQSAKVAVREPIPAPDVAPLAVLCDEQRTHFAVLGADGVVRVVRQSDGVVDGAIVLEQPLLTLPPADGAPPRIVSGGLLLGQPGFTLTTSDGRALYVTVRFETTWEAERKLIRPVIDAPVEVEVDPGHMAVRACAASARDRSTALVATRADGSLLLVERLAEENAFSGELTVSTQQRTLASPAPIDQLVIDSRRENVFGATRDGRLLWWNLLDRRASEPTVTAVGAPITALALLIGDQSLVVGQADGGLSVWYRIAPEGGRVRLVRTHELPPLPTAIRHLAASWRDRTFAAQDESGELGLYYSTSSRVLWRGQSPLGDASALALAPKNNGALLAASGTLAQLDIESHHPEAGLRAFFGKVWYEGYPEPAHIWQSSSGSNEAEAKLGLAPLLFGTLKATLFSLLFAVPLALLAAMYTSQLMHWKIRRYVKPAVEIMASLPSVVLGFLAGLWLAPRLTTVFLALPLFLLFAPVATIAAGRLGERLPARWRRGVPEGFAAIGFIGVLALVLGAALALSRPLERALFDGDFVAWMRGVLGVTYDSKNCIVLGLAMGIAVIPIIFAIAEDAFSNVPRSLVSASLALGADRWYTVTRVVLPTASPGLFSAVMVGFGRAVGETMIVVMASGNTPIIDWNLFNGLRSLSANIATEIPEAPEGGTLYRTLFLAALLLFAVTFTVNTAAELVRQHLRERYARL